MRHYFKCLYFILKKIVQQVDLGEDVEARDFPFPPRRLYFFEWWGRCIAGVSFAKGRHVSY